MQQAIDFGPYSSNLGTRKKDKLNCKGGEGFYAGAKNDILTNASFTVDDTNSPGGYATYPSVMSGGGGNDKYRFKSDGWGFIADGGGGNDIVSFPKKSPFNPKLWYDGTMVNMVLINNRDVLLSTTSLKDGGRANGILFGDPFGQYNKANRIEQVKFGNKKYKFKNLYKNQIRTAKSEKWGNYYTFSTSTFEELSDAGALNLSAFNDFSQLESGAYLDIAVHNNSLAV